MLFMTELLTAACSQLQQILKLSYPLNSKGNSPMSVYETSFRVMTGSLSRFPTDLRPMQNFFDTTMNKFS